LSDKGEEFPVHQRGAEYISLVYDEKRTPKTEYPHPLTEYLARRFQLKSGARLLELGCGRGDVLQAFRTTALNVMGSIAKRQRNRSARELTSLCAILRNSGNRILTVFSTSSITSLLSSTFTLRTI
jgi:hypothetical protein